MSTPLSRNMNLLAVSYGVIALLTIALVAIIIYLGVGPMFFILPVLFLVHHPQPPLSATRG
jgi:hypothetical protein